MTDETNIYLTKAAIFIACWLIVVAMTISGRFLAKMAPEDMPQTYEELTLPLVSAVATIWLGVLSLFVLGIVAFVR